MKKIFLASALAIGLFSCKKDDVINEGNGNSIIFTVVCNSCSITVDTKRELNKKVDVIGFYQEGEVNKLKTINITTTGEGEITSTLKSNGNVLHKAINIQNGNTVTYSIKVN